MGRSGMEGEEERCREGGGMKGVIKGAEEGE